MPTVRARREAQAVRYIDRALAGALAGSREAYRAGPRRARPLLALVTRRRRSRRCRRPIRTRCSSTSRPAPPPARARDSHGSSAAFFDLVRTHTLQGTFGDPYYGGNANFVGWDLLGYPGVRTVVTADEQRLGVAVTPTHKSAYDHEMFIKATARVRDDGGPQAVATRLQGHRSRHHRPGRGRRRRRAADRRGRHRCRRARGRYLADAPRLRAGRDPQQRSRLAAGRPEVQPRSADASRQRLGADHAGGQPPDDERRRRNDAALLGAELAAQSVGLQGRQRDDASATAPLAVAERIDGRGLAVRPRRTRAVLRQGRVRDRRLGTGRQRQGRRSIAAATSSRAPRQREYPMPPLRSTGFIDLMAAAARTLRWHPFPGPAAINSAQLSGPIGVHVSRLLQQGRLSRRREERPATDDHSASAEDRPAAGRDARARRLDRRRRTGPRDRRDLRHRRPGVRAAGESRAAGRLYLREHAPAAAVEIEGVSERPVEQPRSGRPPLLQPRAGWRRDGAVPVESEQLVRAAGARRGGRRLRRRQLRSRGLDFIGGGNLWIYSDRRPIAAANMGDVRPHARLGIGMEGVRQRERRSHQHRVPAEDDAARTRTTISISIPR